MRKLLMIMTVLLLVACNKNQKAVKKLDGEWKVTKYLMNEVGKGSIDLIAFGLKIEYKFTACKLKNNEYCDLKIVSVDLDGETLTDVISFKVEADGTKLILHDSNASSTNSLNTQEIEIVELKRKTCKLKERTSSGDFIEIELEKI